MRQRNDTDHPLTVHTDPPQVVAPGEAIDHDTYVVGLTVLDEPDTTPAPVDEQPTPTKPTKTTGKEATR